MLLFNFPRTLKRIITYCDAVLSIQVYKVLEANAKHPATAAEYEKIVEQKKAEEKRKALGAEYRKLVQITLFRTKGRSGESQNFSFFINSKHVCSLENDTYLVFNLMPGLYEFAFQPEDTQTSSVKTLAASTKKYNILVSKGYPYEFTVPTIS